MGVLVGGSGVVQPGGDDRALQGQATLQGHGLLVASVSHGRECAGSGAGCLLRLPVLPGSDEHEHQPVRPGRHQQRVTGPFRGRHGPVSRDPGQVRFAELGQGRRAGLVRRGQ